MRATQFGLYFLVVALAVPAAAQKVRIDYDRSADFDSYETFAWVRTDATSVRDSSPLMDSRIKNAIEYRLTEGGMVEADDSPDVYITYHTDEKEEMQLNTSNYGYRYGPSWGWDPYWGGSFGMSGSTTTVTTYERGTLIIDIWDADKKQLVWRGSAEATIPSKPEKQAKLIDRALTKIVKKWDKMYSR